MTRFNVLSVVLGTVVLVAIAVAAPEIDNNEGDNFQYMRARRGSKAKDAGMSAEVKLDDRTKFFLTFLQDQIKEKIKALTKADEVRGNIEGIVTSFKEFKKPGKPTDFDLSWGSNIFVKIKAKVVTKKKEEEKYFHIRIFKGTHSDDYPRFVGIDIAKTGVRNAKEGIEPFGMFKEFQPDPMKLPVVKL